MQPQPLFEPCRRTRTHPTPHAPHAAHTPHTPCTHPRCRQRRAPTHTMTHGRTTYPRPHSDAPCRRPRLDVPHASCASPTCHNPCPCHACHATDMALHWPPHLDAPPIMRTAANPCTTRDDASRALQHTFGLTHGSLLHAFPAPTARPYEPRTSPCLGRTHDRTRTAPQPAH